MIIHTLEACIGNVHPVWQVWRSNMPGMKQRHCKAHEVPVYLLSNGKVEYAACLGYKALRNDFKLPKVQLVCLSSHGGG